MDNQALVSGNEVIDEKKWCKYFIPIYIIPFFVIGGIIFGVFFLDNIYFQAPGILVIFSIIFVLTGIILIKYVYYKIGYYIYFIYIIISTMRAVYFLFAFLVLSLLVQLFVSAFDKTDEDKKETEEKFFWMRLQMFLYFVITCCIEYVLFFSLIRRLKLFDDYEKYRLRQLGNITPV